MAVLHNRISNKELKQRLFAETEPRITISFYCYFPIPDPAAFRDAFYIALTELKVFGRIYVASEGINAQASVPESNYEALKNYLYSFPELNGLRLNRAVDDDGKSFWVLRIKVREKIVADGITDPTFSLENRGRYADAEKWNQLMEKDGTIVIDMRNHYEYEVGHFEQALEIPSDTFKEQLHMALDMMQPYKDKNILMYCTGGIRCEKASAWMLHNGFNNVFHLEGGIINYVNQAKEKGLPLKFHGKNFVFDERLGERVTEEVIARCHQCSKPADTHTNCNNSGCHLLFIQCAECAAEFDGCCSAECRDVYHLPEEEQKKLRAGKQNGQMIFSKSRKGLKAIAKK